MATTNSTVTNTNTNISDRLPQKAQANDLVTLVSGQSIVVKVQAGHYYKVRSLGKASDSGNLQIPDHVIATHQGDALFLRYADGSTVTFENFYTVCTDSIACSVNVASDRSTGMTLTSGMESGGVTTADGGRMVYAHGGHDQLMAMARGQTSMEKTFSSMGDSPSLTYLPQTYTSPLGFLSEIDGLAILASVGGALAMGLAAGGGGGGGGGDSPGTDAAAQAAQAVTNALNTISSAAQNHSATSTTPSANTYRDAGVTGVTSSNVGAISSSLNSALMTGAQANTAAKIQLIVDAYNTILAEANGAAPDATPNVNPTVAQYDAIGASIGAAHGTVANLALLNNMIGAQETSGVDTVGEIDNLARIANAIELTAAGGTPTTALTAADFMLAGVTGITAANLPLMLAAVAARADDGSQTDSLAALQALADTTPPATPVVGAIAVDNFINAAEANAGFDITGTGEAGATVALTLSSGVTLAGGNTALVSSNGTWTIHVTPADVAALGQGNESIHAVQTDIWGNASQPSNQDITVDQALPTAPRTVLATDSGSSNSDGITAISSVNVTGLETHATWQYQVDGGGWTGGTGSSFDLSSGTHSYAVHQTDQAGNPSGNSTPISYTLDSQAPIPLTLALQTDTGSNTGDRITNDNRVNVTGLETNASWQYQVDPAPTGSWTTGTTDSAGVGHFLLTDGTHSYAVRQTDVAGNPSSASSPSTYTLDTAGPTAQITYTNGATLGSFHLTFTFNEAVVGFDLADIVTGGTLGALTGSGNSYVADISFVGWGTPGLDTHVGIRFASFDDVAGNHNSLPTVSVPVI